MLRADPSTDLTRVPAALALLAALAAPGVTLLARVAPALDGLERLAYGVPLGTVAGTLALFVLACALGLSCTLVISSGIASALIAFALLARRPPAPATLSSAAFAPSAAHAADRAPDAASQTESRPDLLERLTAPGTLVPLAILGGFAIRWAILWWSALAVDDTGLQAGFTNLWADWSQHLGDVSSFAYGGNFPPVHPRLAGHGFPYHYLTSVTAAAMVQLGLDPIVALPLQSYVFSLALLLGLYAFACRLTADRVTAAIAVALFLIGGGWGFWLPVREAFRTPGALSALIHAPWDRGAEEAANFRWPNFYYALIAPQRAYLYGLPLGLLTLRLLPGAGAGGGRRTFALAGIVAGLLPLAHQGTLLSLALITPFLVLLYPGRGWLIFFAVWALVAAPQLLLLLGGGAGALGAFRFHVGWIAQPDPWIWFWLKNLGLIAPLAVGGLLWPAALPGASRRFLIGLMPAFLIANLFLFQPWDWDNTKILTFWYLGISILCAAALVRMWRKWTGPVARLALAALFASMVLSGALLDLNQLIGRDRHLMLTTEELELARMIRERTPRGSLFAAGLRHNHPVTMLTGRRVLLGYPAWLWSQGMDVSREERDVRAILAYAPEAPALMARYGVDYVVIGPEEFRKLGANPGAYASRYPCVIRTRSYCVFAVRRGAPPRAGG
jgi:hypothetical protein